jgi:hypothetical protein
MNSTLLYNLIRFILLLAVQVLIFNNINFLGFINPFPYLLFIILYPVNGNKNALLLSSFLLGLLMDLFWNSGGIHTTACLTLAYLRPYLFKFSFGLSYEYQTVKILDKLSPERFSFIVLSVILHHFTLFILEIFTLMSIWEIIVRTLVSTIYTTILSILIIYLIKPIK